MKKITTILMLLMLSMGATRVVAQDFRVQISENADNRTHITNPANLAAGDVIVLQTADNASKYLAGATKAESGNENTYYQLVAGNGGTYKLASYKSVVENAPVYIKAPTGTGQDPIQTTTVESEAAQFSLSTQATNHIRFTAKVNNTGANTFLNCNTTNNSTKWATGTGGWSYWKVFKTDASSSYLWKVTFNCVTEDNQTLQETSGYYADGETVNAPQIIGYSVKEGETSSVTVNGAAITQTVVYATSTFDYTLVVNGAPEGTAITIMGSPVSVGDVSFASEVTENDVVVTFPTGFEFYVYNVTVDGTTITVNCDDPRWPVNFPKTTTFKDDGRHINSASFNDQTVDGLWESINTPCYQDLTATKTVTLPSNTSVKPSFNVKGVWQHGFVYIDLNNDGDFTDEGELVAKINEGNPNLSTAIPAFTSPATEGTYRMRIKTDWASEDPGGNIDPSNHIINNRGQIVDLTLVVVGGVEVTYTYKFDGNVVNNETLTVPVGEAFPTPTLPFGFTGSAPEGTVTEADNGTTKEIDMTWTLFQYADSYDNISQWYNVRMHSNQTNYLYNNNGAVAFTNAVGKNDYLWGFVGDPINGFQVYNYTAGGSVAIDNTEPASALSADGTSVSFKVASSAQGNNGASADYFFALYVTEGNYLNYQQGQIKRWNDNDAGSTIMINAAQPETDDDIFAAVMAQLDAYTFGDNLGQYGIEGKTTDEANAAINRLQTEGYTPENLAEAQALLAAVKLNLPKAGMFIRMKSTHDTYLSGVASTNSANRLSFTTTADASTIFYFDGDKLLTYGNGLYANGREVAAIGGEGIKYWFEESTITPAKYAVRFNPGSGVDRFLYARDTNENYADQNGADHANCVFTLEEVTELPITLHEATCKDGTTHWFATFSAPVAVSEVVGAEIHKVTDNGSTVYVEPVNNVTGGIPAGTAVLLVSDTETATVKLGETNDDFETALLPLYACEKGKAGFFFGKGGENGYAGFYTIGGETPTGGFKAYIAADSTGSAKVLDFGNEATGINTIENGAENGAVYNLQGQRVNKAQKGVFIQNGKKVVLK